MRRSPPPSPAGDPVTTATPPTSVRAGGELAGGGQRLLRPQLGELLVDVAQPGEHAADPLDEAVLRRLQQVGELPDQVALAGQVAEALEADDRLDPARARSRPTTRR